MIMQPGGGKTPDPSAVSSIQERRDEKKRAERRLWMIRGLSLGGFLVVAVFVVWLTLFSSSLAFRVGNIEINGADKTNDPASTAKAIAEATAPYQGVPLLRLPLSDIQTQLEKNPNIYHAAIKRAWPTGLVITVEPRVPSMMQAVDGGFDLLGPDGGSVGIVPEPFAGIPSVVLSGYGTDQAEREAAEVVKVWKALSDDFKPKVTLITVTGGDITMKLASGADVLWGNVERSESKAQVLQLLVANREATVYDVMDPARPSTR